MVEQNETLGGDPVDEIWWESILAENSSENKPPTLQAGYINQNDDEIDWDLAHQAFKDDEILNVIAYGFNRGGILVKNEKFHGFIPISHLVKYEESTSIEERRKLLKGYLSKNISVKVIECSRQNERIVLSERAAISAEGSRNRLLSVIHEGDVIEGVVTNITDFGIFIDLGGVEGLAHVSELSWGRVSHPKEIVHVGQKIKTLILSVDRENNKIALSLKRLQSNPWTSFSDKYRPGDRLPAKISAIMRFGVFVQLEEGIEGLVHISVLGGTLKPQDLRIKFKIGDELIVCILRIDAEHHRLGLSLVEDT